jgi:hypothetical protein
MRLGFVGIIAMAFLALEMVGIYRIFQSIGGAPTFLWLIAAVIAGVGVIRRAGAGFLPALAASLERGHAPFGIIWTTGRRFLAGGPCSSCREPSATSSPWSCCCGPPPEFPRPAAPRTRMASSKANSGGKIEPGPRRWRNGGPAWRNIRAKIGAFFLPAPLGPHSP